MVRTPAAAHCLRHTLLGLIGTLLLALGHLSATPAHAQSGIWYYAVQPGENPWSITRRYLRDGLRYWQPLVDRNQIERPRFIPPGTVVTIPASWLRVVPSRATIEIVRGDVQLTEGRETRLAEPGDPITGGERLATSADSTALVRFANGSELLVTQSSEVVFDGLSGYANTLMVDATVRLARGRVETTTTPAGSLDRLEIRSPVAISAVRGTRFRLSSDTDADRLEVLTGRVDIAAAGRSRAVRSGRGTLAREGRPPEPPRRLLPAPTVLGGNARAERLPLRLEVVPVEGAVAYRVQVAPTPDFDALLTDQVDAGPNLPLGNLEDANYALRVRAIDGDGIEGLSLDTLLVVDARPTPPFLIEPPGDGRSRVQPPVFRWAEVEGAAGYRFRLEPGLTGGFQLDLPPSGSFTAPQELPLGVHRWRVATIDGDGQRGPFSDLQTFEQLDPPPVVDGEPVLDEADEPTLRWADAGPGYRYRVQIARDSAFEDVIVDRVVDTNSVAFAAEAASALFVRVAVVEPDGFEGPYGSINRVEVPASRWWPLVLAPLLLLLVL